MSTVFYDHKIRHGGNDYKVSLSFDDASLMKDVARFELIAEFKKAEESEWTPVSIGLELNPEKEQIELFVEGKLIGKIDLKKLPDDFSSSLESESGAQDEIFNPEMEEQLYDSVVGAEIMEQLISSIPADPFLGCLVKGAASTAIGQIIRCWHPHRETHPYKELFGQIRECLQAHAGKMFATFFWRLGRCTLSGGLQ